MKNELHLINSPHNTKTCQLWMHVSRMHKSLCFCVGQGCLQREASDLLSPTLWWGHWRDWCTFSQHESEAQQTNNGRFLPTCRLFRSAQTWKQADQTHRADKRSTGQTNENDLGLMSHKQWPQLDSISSTWVTSTKYCDMTDSAESGVTLTRNGAGRSQCCLFLCGKACT